MRRSSPGRRAHYVLTIALPVIMQPVKAGSHIRRLQLRSRYNVAISQDVPVSRAVNTPAILQLVHSNEAGGVEVLASMIGLGLAAHGMPVDTHVLYGAGGIGRLGKLRAVAGTVARIFRERPQVIIAYQSTACLVAGVAGTLAGCRLRLIHQTALPAEVHPALRWLDKLAGWLGLYSVNIANTVATRQAFAAYPARYTKHLRLIEHGLRPPVAQSSRAETLVRHGIGGEQPVLLNVGRQSDQKAQDRLIRALPLIPRGRLVFAGGGPNEAANRALAAALQVSARIHFLGNLPRDQVADLYGAADRFVFPSTWETFGLAPVEAAMSGLPVIASDLAVLREVLSAHSKTITRFVPAATDAAWAAAINASLDDAGLPRAAAEHAVQIRAKYDEDRMVQAYADLIRAELNLEPVRQRAGG
jgi:L-malate glycosyltransferase